MCLRSTRRRSRTGSRSHTHSTTTRVTRGSGSWSFARDNRNARELEHFGSAAAVVSRGALRDTAFEIAKKIASKHPRVIRAAKEALNGIDPAPPHNSYRYEQGFTFELHLQGVGDE